MERARTGGFAVKAAVVAARPVGALPGAAMTRYERGFAAAAGHDHAVAFAYARTALAAILRAAGLERGDGVILSPLTCKVVPLALLGAGLRPVYADIRRDTLNLDANEASGAAGGDARAILFQHTYGWSGGAAEVARVAEARGMTLIEDCAQCLPQAAPRDRAGDLGLAAIFSNNPGKPLPAGSGGVAVTHDAALAERIRRERDRLPERSGVASLALRAENTLRNRLPPSLYWPAYDFHRRLRRSRADEPVAREIEREVDRVATQIADGDAARGERWLSRLERVRRHRAACCADYAAALAGAACLETISSAAGPLYYFPVLVNGKDALLSRARERRVQLVAWPIRTPIYPVEQAEALRRYGYEPGSCPVAEEVARRLVGLPTDLTISEANRAAVVRVLVER